MQKLSILFFLLFLSLESCSSKEESKDFTQFVNPFIGTDGTGHTFPGACLPFGMVQPSPDNVDIGWDYTSGYQYKNPEILGFSQTHLSGTGINDLGDVLLLPFVENKTESFKTGYNKKTEKASPGLYSVTLNDSIKVNLTATERVAFNQFIYPTNKAKLLIDIQHGLRFLTDSLVLDSKVSIESNTTISGYCHNKNWVQRKYFFTLTFDTPFSNAIELPKKTKEKAPRYILDFVLKNKTLQAKIAFSTVSIEGAKNNLKTELPHWDFEQTVANAKAKWNSYLAKIEIEAPQKQKEIFYTSLYHLFTQPSNIADVDGKYRGADDKIATAPNGEYYSTLSLWDTYRAANPLYTILVPERVNGFINTMLLHHKAAGYLPIWTVWGQENNCMIGNHAIPIITDAYSKGFKDFDANEALQAMIETTTKNHPNNDWTLYSKYGYYPFDKIDNESVSRTLESGYDDYCVALLAEKLGRKTVAKTYYKRASYYKNIFDKETGLMRGKDSQGHWRTPFDPLKPTSPMNNPGDYTEANAWQYSWASTQHDITGVTNLLGGKEQFTKQLNTFFTLNGEKDNRHLGQEGMIGQYAHGNEPSHHISYLYAYSNEPEKGKKLITQIYNQFYNNTPNGITGNDDCGQMSAWYIFTTLGFYPVNPATGAFVFGMPQVKKATIHLAENITLSIICNGKSYKKITLNGTKINGIEINYKQIMQGGELKFE
ncbi:putative alpha-1,2-mannosidase [Flavobacterium sp. 103]|uniref:GH92 family glycosyl hydrolase n=1 Tax=Flavobacterium sp. 103 TaxID=2135624 RepID=UPI000D5EA656|nr:GH92 family glycosyl hydrolase [Flavobacterium sp. 103]PVX47026.1 putative alpha-1,2-mannosidase [Flavobacterium sp. 103]